MGVHGGQMEVTHCRRTSPRRGAKEPSALCLLSYILLGAAEATPWGAKYTKKNKKNETFSSKKRGSYRVMYEALSSFPDR